MRKSSKEYSDLLYESILKCKTLDECRNFFRDLCTVTELQAMEQRIQVAMYLNDGMIYHDILERTGASSATISRVNRCLQYGAGGYTTVIPRMQDYWKAVQERETP